MVWLHLILFSCLGWAIYFLWIAMRACPKKGLKPKKPRKPLAARGRLKRRALYRRWREPTLEQQQFARQCQAYNLAQSRKSEPTIALTAVLDALSVRYEQEVVCWYDGDLFVIIDFVLPDHNLAIELDGLHHRNQHVYDWERDKMISEVMGVRVVRKWNSFFLKPDLTDQLTKIIVS